MSYKKLIIVVVSLLIFYVPAKIVLIEHILGYRVYITNRSTGDQITFLRQNKDNYIIIGKHYFLPDTNYVKVGFSFNNEPGMSIIWNQNNYKMHILVHDIHDNKLDSTQYIASATGYGKSNIYSLNDEARTSLMGGYNLFTILGINDLFSRVNGVDVIVE